MDKKAILFFTMQRSASTFIYLISKHLCQIQNIPYYSPDSPDPYFRFDEDSLTQKDFLKEKYGCFAPIRGFRKIPNVKDYSILLHLRDPRDVAVSMFFSYCYSHPGEIPGYTGYRKEVAEKGIDNFVLEMVQNQRPNIIGDYGTSFGQNLLKRYSDYVYQLLNKSNVIFIKYEEMVSDFESWLRKVIVPFGIREEKIIKSLVKKYKKCFKIKPKFSIFFRSENIWAHKRQIRPGDFKLKLKPKTINKLNILFKDILYKLDYKT